MTLLKYKRLIEIIRNNCTIDNPEEMDTFLDLCTLPKLNEEETEYLTKSIKSNENKSIIYSHPSKENPRIRDSFTVECIKYLKKSLHQFFLNYPKI